MTCEKQHKDLMRFLDNEMDGAELKNFKLHLPNCTICNHQLKDLKSFTSIMNSMKIAELPESVWDNYWNRIHYAISNIHKDNKGLK